MKSEVKILLLGFAPFENLTFESFFKLVGRRNTLYRTVTDALQAQVLLVNGDSPAAVQWASSSVLPTQKALYVGSADPLAKWPTAPRPIKLTTVLGLLDVLVAPDAVAVESKPSPIRQEATILPAQAEAAVPVEPVVPLISVEPATPVVSVAPVEPAIPLVSVEPAVPIVSALQHVIARPTFPAVRKNSVREGSGRGSSNFAASNFLGLGSAPEPRVVTEQFDDILVVDDSVVALKFMQSRLTHYGFRAELAKSGEEALTRVSATKYKFVFLDVMMEGLDGYQTCRAIKQRKYASGKPPVVVMLTSRGGSIDKIRGGLAGCDAYLTKPLNEVELLKVLSKYDEQVEYSFRDTNLGVSGATSSRSHRHQAANVQHIL